MQWVKYLQNQKNQNNKSVSLLSTCFMMKEGDNGKNLMIPRVRKSWFHISTPKEMEDMSVSVPCIGQAVH